MNISRLEDRFDNNIIPIIGLSGNPLALTFAKSNLLFERRLQLLMQYASNFDKEKLLLLHINFWQGGQIINQPAIRELLNSIPGIRLIIDENFPNIEDTLHNPLIHKLIESYPLWLNEFGSGMCSMVPVLASLFEGVIISRDFYTKFNSELFFDITIDIIKKYTKYIIIDDNSCLRQIV